MSSHAKSSTLPSCFRPYAKHRSTTSELPSLPATDSGSPNLTTSVYKTSNGLFALTWFRNVLGRSLHLHVLLDAVDGVGGGGDLSSTPSFSLNLKPLIFWNRTGFRKLNLPNNKSKCIHIFWDFSRAKFASQAEPVSGYYVAAVIDGSIAFLAGDSPAEAYSKTKSIKSSKTQSFILRREHVYGNKVYTTKAQFGGRTREITIDCRTGDDSRLYFSVDRKRVLQIKHLKWKFRGNDRIEIDGINVQISWDVYNWLFDDENEDGYALFMFRFEKNGFEEIEEEDKNKSSLFWSQQSCGFGFEKMKMRKGLLRSSAAARSSSSSSLSSASSSCSSVMEWASMEENELKGPSSGFSLLVYAWKS
ncbi:uncharacterized protein LOC124910076 [Impatiens glandulifera]|uniref:uncharacterized protein LOC124910076 n=1 Tax=Impatiens glandulifera TaxID=253017 RepID=UPI001FB19F99|nr:uncharacterized protein LOC124910076 [Impatiens glandulifera]